MSKLNWGKAKSRKQVAVSSPGPKKTKLLSQAQLLARKIIQQEKNRSRAERLRKARDKAELLRKQRTAVFEEPSE